MDEGSGNEGEEGFEDQILGDPDIGEMRFHELASHFERLRETMRNINQPKNKDDWDESTKKSTD